MVRLPSGAFRRRVVPQGVGTAAFGGCSPELKDVSGAGLLLSRDGSASPSCSITPQRRAPAVARRRSTSCSVAERRRLEDSYVVEESVLGSGGFGTVRRAWPKTNGPACVVKTLPKCSRQGASHDHLAESARHEAEVLRRLDHGHICKIVDVYEDDSHVYLVLEYIEGRELFDEVCEHGPLDERRAAQIMRQIFEALEHCHAPVRSVLHRDLKPENVMVGLGGEDPAVKIIDFGLAALCPENGVLQTPIVGTAEYLAPEALAEGLYSRASDLWGAGAVLHMMLTGGALPAPVGANRCNMELLQKLNVSTAAQELLKGLLRIKPEDRLTAAEARMHPWTQGIDSRENLAIAADNADSDGIIVDTAVMPEMQHGLGDSVVYADFEAADTDDNGIACKAADTGDHQCRGMLYPGFCSSIGVENNLLQGNDIDDLCKTSCVDVGKLPVAVGSNFKENVLPGTQKCHGRRKGKPLFKLTTDEHTIHTKVPVCHKFNEPANHRRPVLLR